MNPGPRCVRSDRCDHGRGRGEARANLSRSLEDSVTITEPLMPWTVSAVYMATTLGVSTLAYAPWAVYLLWRQVLFAPARRALPQNGRGSAPG
ncbi:MAG: Na+/H+ antiporter NhaC family protein [Gemmatimonadales bacterium]